jgi:hypothetical protein
MTFILPRPLARGCSNGPPTQVNRASFGEAASCVKNSPILGIRISPIFRLSDTWLSSTGKLKQFGNSVNTYF